MPSSPRSAPGSDNRRTFLRRAMAAGAFVLATGRRSGADDAAVAFPGAQGFGAQSRGGRGGRTLPVTSLDDHPRDPAPGTLRWAVQQSGPRIVEFQVAGTIALKAELRIREPFLTIDGSTAPGAGVCLRDHCLSLNRTHDVVVRYLRLRRGDVETLKAVRAAGLERPSGSADLDCVSIEHCDNVLFDRCSLSWSNDEIIGIVDCRNVTIQWCILSEPLRNPRIHPYGDDHAFGLNTSASTLTLHHNLFAHYVMRGPQFEANDVRRDQGHDVRFEAVNNVLFDYERSGSRYTTGIEDDPAAAAGTKFQFQFINNLYLNGDSRLPEIEAETKHGVVPAVQVYVAGNVGPHRPRDEGDPLASVFVDRRPLREGPADVLAQIAGGPLFQPPVSVTVQPAAEILPHILEEAGCSRVRDAVDRRIVENVHAMRTGRTIKSQDDVGGWPALM